MLSKDVREKYLKFFESKGNKRIAPAPLVLENDPTTLFTSSGMQPLVPYLMGKVHPDGKRLVDSQPSIRMQDIEEVGDNRHNTFFEMLGNWSLGDYFKKDQLAWIWEFITKELNLPKERLYVTIFEGNDQVPEDTEAYEIWKSLGVPENHIFKYGVKKNWWSRAGTPEQMPVGEMGGPDSEIFFEFDSVTHDKKFGDECHPNCDCGRFLEIGNSVFMQFVKTNSGLEELPNKNVDFGGGLERLTAATIDDSDVFKTDLFWPIIEEIETISGKKYEGNEASMRVIADHLKASVFLVRDGILPSNKLQGYVLRRLLRRAATKAFRMDKNFGDSGHFHKLINAAAQIYKGVYLQGVDLNKVQETIVNEILNFRKTLEKGMSLLGKVTPFDLYQSYGFPGELIEELYLEKGLDFDKDNFEKDLQKHKDLSKAKSSELFKINKSN